MVSLTRAIELVSKLQRTKKFPTDEEGLGLKCLAQGLQHASEVTKVGPSRIIDRCADISEWCPSDAELLLIAGDLAREDAVVAGTYDPLGNRADKAQNQSRAELEAQYGKPVPVDVAASMARMGGTLAQRRHREMWARLRVHFGIVGSGDYPSWDQCARAAREFGYPDYADAWEKSLVK